MIIVRNIEVYTPKYLGKKDVCICGGRIEWIENSIDIGNQRVHEIDGTGKLLVPGFIDQHVHITGGGGEASFRSRAPRVELSEMICGGTTTVMGLLGTDGLTRNAENLLAQAKALSEEGVTAYICTGHYGYPSVTVTGSVQKDIVFIQEVLGLKLALSDHRAPNVSKEQLIRIASDVRVAGMVGGKAGIVLLHMGDDKKGLKPVFDILEDISIPTQVFRPTHVNRNPHLLEDGMKFLKMGGYVDFTCGISDEPTPGECILEAKRRELPLGHITISSDGHGSWSRYDAEGNVIKMGVSSLQGIYTEFKNMVQNCSMSVEEALPFLTSNVARGLKLYPKKGCICENADADLLIMDQELNLDTVIAKGKIMLEHGEIVKKGLYED